eukprot:13500058-Alexandrium_andersonii.AAC.1
MGHEGAKQRTRKMAGSWRRPGAERCGRSLADGSIHKPVRTQCCGGARAVPIAAVVSCMRQSRVKLWVGKSSIPQRSTIMGTMISRQ